MEVPFDAVRSVIVVLSIIVRNADTVGTIPGLTLNDMKQVRTYNLTTTSSSGKGSQNVVDGNIAQTAATCFVSNKELSPWWLMDFVNHTYVHHVTIYLPTDSYADEFHDVNVFIMAGETGTGGNTDNYVWGERPDPTKLKSALCNRISGKVTSIANLTCQRSPDLPFGIKLYINFGENGITNTNRVLALCEVQVFGVVPLCLQKPPICLNGQTCFPLDFMYIDPFSNIRCHCYGYTGLYCETPIDECESQPCQNGAMCTDMVADYNCNCIPGYSDKNCATDTNECASYPCQNDAPCEDRINEYRCHCEGFTGERCESEIDECKSVVCHYGGTCQDAIASYKCVCVHGYAGVLCEDQVNECESAPCRNKATCLDQLDSFYCMCATPYYGPICAVDASIQTCHASTCENGNCTDFALGYQCTCKPGYGGTNCEININECASHPCQHAGSCTDNPNAFSCSCAAGYTGETCATDVDECSSGPCLNGGTCTDNVNSYSCSCAYGYATGNCSVYTLSEVTTSDPSELCSLCENHAKCRTEHDNYTCICGTGFTGLHCETDVLNRNLVDECASQPCAKDRAKCVDETYGYVCMCFPGSVGVTCSELCPHGYFGEGCSGRCHCLNDAPCDPMSGACPGGACAAGFTEQSCSAKREENANASWWMILVACISMICGIIALVILGMYIKKKKDRKKIYSTSRGEDVTALTEGEPLSEEEDYILELDYASGSKVLARLDQDVAEPAKVTKNPPGSEKVTSKDPSGSKVGTKGPPVTANVADDYILELDYASGSKVLARLDKDVAGSTKVAKNPPGSAKVDEYEWGSSGSGSTFSSSPSTSEMEINV